VRENFGLIIESLVAVLLLLTISFCMVLNRRLKKLKADEHALKATISELITATEIAERAIAGLKLTVRDCDENLGERLHAGESLARELARQHKNSEELLSRLAQISIAARPTQPAPRPVETPQAPPDARATAAAANAFAARARQRGSAAA
jgi:chromosome segregation ATPase